MRAFVVLSFSLLLTLSSVSLPAQSKLPPQKFSLPENTVSADYLNGLLLAKLKPEYRGMAASANGARTSSLPDVTIRPLTNPMMTRRSQEARAREFNIDLSLYVRLHIPPAADIEKRINELYATGFFEIIEPSYVDRMDVTPNDPLAAGNQYYLSLIRAYEAWDITQGDTQTVIAIVDSGGDLVHPDLAGNIYTNPDEIPNNNLDDDGDGYIDNINGWDFVGADTLNIFNSSFTGDNDPQLKQTGNPGTLGHGVWVAGCASASTNNNIGISGVGYKTRLLITKHTADNQRVAAPGIYSGYAGVLYAAQTLTADNVPRKIINCSWGGTFRSQIQQDIITHVTLDLGCLVVAAAGNNNNGGLFYPAAYDHVLSVAATDQTDARASFSNFGPTVDVTAPGVSITTTSYGNQYGSISGTSFSSPITAGAAALVWSNHPAFSPRQVAEQLRVSADNVDTQSPSFALQLGKGRINIRNALTLSLPSVRASKATLLNAQGNPPAPGQESFLTMDLTNYLQGTSAGFTITASSVSPFITFSKSQITAGVINGGSSIRNSSNPIKLSIGAAAPENTTVQIKLSMSDGSYSDFQFVDLLINPSFITVDENKINTTVASTGRIGFDDPANSKNGTGFIFNDNSLLFEMGLIMGTSGTNLYNNVRGTNGFYEQDFVKTSSIKKLVPGLRTSSEVFGSFSPTSLPGLVISYRSMAMKESPSPNDKFIILEYILKNNGAAPITNFRLGLFADWDISGSGAKDAAGWNSARQIGYVYPKGSTGLPYAGIQTLNQTGTHYAIDNSQTIAGNPFGLYDGFTRDEKFTSISQERLSAGETSASGNDVSHVVSVNPLTIAAGGEVVVAFAIHAANNLSDLLASADAANALYNTVFNLPRPAAPEVETCYGSSATLSATGASTLNWYKDFTGGTPLQSGPSITTANLKADTILYVSSADHATYESIRTPATVRIKANPNISASPSSELCDGQSTTLSVKSTDEYTWSSGGTTQSINVTTQGNYSVTVKYNSLNCTSVSTPFFVKVNPSPIAAFVQGELRSGIPINFSDQSTGAISWQWDFGDGTTSSDKNPAKLYPTSKNYTVSLKITAANGCQASVSKALNVITGLEESASESFAVFPNPAKDYLTIQGPSESLAAVELTSIQGELVLSSTMPAGQLSLFVGGLSEGMYVLRITSSNLLHTHKVIIRR